MASLPDKGLMGISPNCVDFIVSKFHLVFLHKWHFEKRACCHSSFLYAKNARMSAVFLNCLQTGSNTSFVSIKNCLSLLIFKVFPYSPKNLLKVSATLSVSDIILPPSLNMTLLVAIILFEKFSLTTLQKFSLSVMRLTFKNHNFFVFYNLVCSSGWIPLETCFLISFQSL